MKYKKAWHSKAPRVYEPFDPAYTLTYDDILRLTPYNNLNLRSAIKAGEFPAPKHFAHSHVRFNPDDVEEWLRCKANGEVWRKA